MLAAQANDSLLWVIVGVLAVVALLVFILRHH